MRVLIPVDHAVGISGPHRNVVGSLNALGARDDVEVVLLTSMIDANEPYASAPNVDVRLGFGPRKKASILSNLRAIRSAVRGCDVIYVPTNLTSLVLAQPVRPGRRLVAGPNVTHLPVRRRDAPGFLELRVLSDAWFEASRVRRDHVRRVSGIQEVGYIHHAIDTRKFAPSHRDPAIWEAHGVPTNAVTVLYVGRDDEPRKGVSQLLDAAECLGSARDDLHFVLVGKMSESTIARIAGMKDVTLAGFRMADDLPALYASADISVVPSSWENFPFTVMEAMASGLPIVAARVGGIPEMIVDGESGTLVEIVAGGRHRLDAGQILADAIGRLADDSELRKRLGGKARRRVLEHFSEQRLGEDLMATFRGEPFREQDALASKGLQ